MNFYDHHQIDLWKIEMITIADLDFQDVPHLKIMIDLFIMSTNGLWLFICDDWIECSLCIMPKLIYKCVDGQWIVVNNGNTVAIVGGISLFVIHSFVRYVWYASNKWINKFPAIYESPTQRLMLNATLHSYFQCWFIGHLCSHSQWMTNTIFRHRHCQ